MHEQAKLAAYSTPYWWEAAPVRVLPSQQLAKRVDVAIVGAGYAGLTAALTLARAGRAVAVLDAMNPGEGASSRNSGITSGRIRPGPAAIARRFGEATALAIEAEGKIAREYLYDFIRTEGLDCDFRLTGEFKGALGFDQYETMARSADMLAKRLGIESYAVPQTEQQSYIGTGFYRGGTVRMDFGGLNPAKLHAELLRVAQNAGVVVHAQTSVTAIDRAGSNFSVETGAGIVLARRALVCTNGYTDGAAPYLRWCLVPVRRRMIATEVLPPDVMAAARTGRWDAPRPTAAGRGLRDAAVQRSRTGHSGSQQLFLLDDVVDAEEAPFRYACARSALDASAMSNTVVSDRDTNVRL